MTRGIGTRDSQDGWVFKGKTHVTGGARGDYLLGKLGCDNKICYDINRSKYNIINPFKSDIFLYHYHKDSYRSYDNINDNDRLPRPYAYTSESTLNNKSDILFNFSKV